jgi:hypothetical protein
MRSLDHKCEEYRFSAVERLEVIIQRIHGRLVLIIRSICLEDFIERHRVVFVPIRIYSV